MQQPNFGITTPAPSGGLRKLELNGCKSENPPFQWYQILTITSHLFKASLMKARLSDLIKIIMHRKVTIAEILTPFRPPKQNS